MSKKTKAILPTLLSLCGAIGVKEFSDLIGDAPGSNRPKNTSKEEERRRRQLERLKHDRKTEST